MGFVGQALIEVDDTNSVGVDWVNSEQLQEFAHVAHEEVTQVFLLAFQVSLQSPFVTAVHRSSILVSAGAGRNPLSWNLP
jgi:hypothetical protein